MLEFDAPRIITQNKIIPKCWEQHVHPTKSIQTLEFDNKIQCNSFGNPHPGFERILPNSDVWMESEDSHWDDVLPSRRIWKLTNLEQQIEASPSDESTNTPEYDKCMVSIIDIHVYKKSDKNW